MHPHRDEFIIGGRRLIYSHQDAQPDKTTTSMTEQNGTRIFNMERLLSRTSGKQTRSGSRKYSRTEFSTVCARGRGINSESTEPPVRTRHRRQEEIDNRKQYEEAEGERRNVEPKQVEGGDAQVEHSE